MAFTVQDDDGSVDDANAYIQVSELLAYHADRGNTVTGTTQTQEEAIVRATDYLDTRFSYIGSRKTVDQPTEWPRFDAVDMSGRIVLGIPKEVKDATSEYALRALSATLVADPTRDATGQTVKREGIKADVVETDVEYAGGSVFVMPKYPEADRKLTRAGLTLARGILQRA